MKSRSRTKSSRKSNREKEKKDFIKLLKKEGPHVLMERIVEDPDISLEEFRSIAMLVTSNVLLFFKKDSKTKEVQECNKSEIYEGLTETKEVVFQNMKNGIEYVGALFGGYIAFDKIFKIAPDKTFSGANNIILLILLFASTYGYSYFKKAHQVHTFKKQKPDYVQEHKEGVLEPYDGDLLREIVDNKVHERFSFYTENLTVSSLQELRYLLLFDSKEKIPNLLKPVHFFRTTGELRTSVGEMARAIEYHRSYMDYAKRGLHHLERFTKKTFKKIKKWYQGNSNKKSRSKSRNNSKR